MITLRVATADDAEAVGELMTALNESVGPSPGEGETTVTTQQARSRITAMASSEQVLLAHVDGSAAGLLSLRIVPQLSQDVPYAEVTELFVREERRRAGIGRLLMAEAEFIARRTGCTYVHVNAWHDNADAHAFYRASAYEPQVVGFEKTLPRKTDARKRRAEG